MQLSTTASLARQTRPLRIRLLHDNPPLTTAERLAVEELILSAAAAVDQADTNGALMVSRALLAEHLDKVVHAADESVVLEQETRPSWRGAADVYNPVVGLGEVGYVVTERRDGEVLLSDDYRCGPVTTLDEASAELSRLRGSHGADAYDMVLVELREVAELATPAATS